MSLIDATAGFRQRQMDRMISQLETLYEKAGNNFSAFRALAAGDLPSAIRRLPEFISSARNVNNRAYESMAGGPNQDWIVPLFNVFGEAYTALDLESRKQIIRHILNYFNSLRYDYSQNHVELIMSGELVADLIANNGLYWPGLDRPKYQLQGKNLDALKRMPPGDLDSFWIALAIIYNDSCGTLPIRQWYYKEFPDAVESAVAYLAMAFAESSEDAARENGTEFEAELSNRLNKRLDPAIHDRVRKKIEEREWLVLPK